GPLLLAGCRDGLDGEFLVGDGYHMATSLPARRLRDAAELWEAPLAKLFIQHPRYSDDELVQTARQVVGDLVGAVLAGPGIVEILPLGLTKATGLSLAAHRLGLTWADTIAFGDMP